MRHESLPPFPVEQWTLANGLRVVLQPDAATPLIASTLCYAAGSRYDPAARPGLAHLCEHLAFHGPRSAAGCSFPERIAGAGGSAQATTTIDSLCFSAIFPRRELAAVMAVEAERMACPLQPEDAEALEIQRRVLLEELGERSLSRVRAAAFEHLHRLLFAPDHPYHRPPAGAAEGIRAVTLDEVRAFAAARLTPSNAVLVLVGDLSAAAAAQVNRAFESLPAGLARPPAAVPERRPPAGERRQTVPAAMPQAQAYLAWTVAGFGQDEWYRAALLMRGLAAGRSSPLARELVERAGLAREVHGHLVSMRDASTLAFAAAAAPGVEGRRLEQGLVEAADLLLSQGLAAGGLLRARKKALSDHYFVAQSLERRADLCASLASCVGAPERLETEPRRISQPDQGDVAGFAHCLLQQPARAVLSLVPQQEAA